MGGSGCQELCCPLLEAVVGSRSVERDDGDEDIQYVGDKRELVIVPVVIRA